MDFFTSGYSDRPPQPGEPAPRPPDRVVHTVVSGPEPGYVATPVFVVAAALQILDDRRALQHAGGVFTAGALFYPVRAALITRLQRSGIDIGVVCANETTTGPCRRASCRP